MYITQNKGKKLIPIIAKIQIIILNHLYKSQTAVSFKIEKKW